MYAPHICPVSQPSQPPSCMWRDLAELEPQNWQGHEEISLEPKFSELFPYNKTQSKILEVKRKDEI